MKRNFSIICAVLLAVTVINLDISALTIGGKTMVRNGVGRRTMIFTLYYAYLYVPQPLKGKSAKAIINANEPMAVNMKIDSSAIKREKFVKAIKDGFQKAASSGYSAPASKRQQFLNLFNGHEIKKGDWIFLKYIPGAGIVASMKKTSGTIKHLGSVSGIQLKKALFAIWLGPNPVQGSLKKAMLGK